MSLLTLAVCSVTNSMRKIFYYSQYGHLYEYRDSLYYQYGYPLAVNLHDISIIEVINPVHLVILDEIYDLNLRIIYVKVKY